MANACAYVNSVDSALHELAQLAKEVVFHKGLKHFWVMLVAPGYELCDVPQLICDGLAVCLCGLPEAFQPPHSIPAPHQHRSSEKGDGGREGETERRDRG